MSVEQVCDSGVGQECLASLRAMFAERCRGDARWLAGLHEAGRAVAGRRERLRVLDEFSGDEVVAALGWSLSMAGRLLVLADDLLVRLPEVHAAMAAGVLELGKARVFSEWTRELEPDHAHHVCAVVLPEAPRCHVGELITRVQAVAAALDPAWAARRLEAAHRGATVFGAMNPAGTANVVGRDLDPVAAVAAMARIDELAAGLRTALRVREVHHPVGWLRAKVYERLLDGTATGLEDDTLLDTLLTELTPDHPEDGPDSLDGPDGGPDGPDDPDDGPDDSGGGPHGLDGPGGADDGGPNDSSPDDGNGPDGPRGTDDGGPDGEGDGVVREPAPEARRATRTGTVEVRMRLSTAMGLDDHPAEVPSWGWVTAANARTLIDRRHDGEWRLVLTDPDGHLEHLFLLPHRPREPTPGPGPGAGAGSRGRGRGRGRGRAVIELQVPTAVLADLDPDAHPMWAAMLRHAHARLTTLPSLTPDDHPATSRGDAARRRARTELDRWVRTRDRCCVGVMCTRTAHHADLDHTLDWTHGGITVAANLGALCRHTHRLKHHGSWTLHQPSPGFFRWTSRAGLTHDVRPRPVTPALPDPRPRPDRRARVPVEEALHPEHTHVHYDDDEPSWLARRTPEPRATTRTTTTDDDPTPRSATGIHYPDEPPF